MSKTESAKAALARIRVAINNCAPADPQDVENLLSCFVAPGTAVVDVIDLRRIKPNLPAPFAPGRNAILGERLNACGVQIRNFLRSFTESCVD
jgi:hypothetical protein